MNHMDVFWKIAAGSKFDFKRFQSDAKKLKILKTKNTAASKSDCDKDQLDKISGQSLEQDMETMKSLAESLRNTIADGSAVAEFQRLYREKPGVTMNAAKLPNNKKYNRYNDILPYDDTRVKLSGVQNYINANYINMPINESLSKEHPSVRHYIASQGPLPNTVSDFWHLIWEKEVSHVVMLTGEVEKGIVKCHRYWPQSIGQTQTHGQLTVEFTDEQKTKTTSLRKFRLSLSETNSKVKESRVINHFQYLGWPDHGVPREHADFLLFVDTVCKTSDDFVGSHPAIVHCSAGVGRTGVFIGLVTAMQRMKVGQPFVVLDLVRHMRDQRGGCVQTPEQFKFLCEAILRAYEGHINSNNSASGALLTEDSENPLPELNDNAESSTSDDDSGTSMDDEDDISADDDEEMDFKSEDERLSLGDGDSDNVTEPASKKFRVDNINLMASEKKAKKKELTAEQQAKIHQEEVNHFRNVNHIHVYGTDIPEPMRTFDELQTLYNVNPKIIENLQSMMFHTPTVIEMQAVPVMMHRRELMACAPTGSGKTLAFVLPIIHHLKSPQKDGFRALCLAPTRELAEQTCREFNRIGDGIGLKVHFIHSVSDDLKKFGVNIFKKFDVLVTTPNRLVHLLQEEKSLSLNSVQWLVIDESDKLFEDGKTGFRDQLATIYKACSSKDIRRAMFSATFSHDVEEWCKLNLDNVIQVYIGARNTVAQTIDQKLLYVGDESGKVIAIRDIIKKGFQPPMLVFVQSKERAKELFHVLEYDGVRVDAIHADKTQAQRDKIVSEFRSGDIWILICTDVMCRGMDFKAVNVVINYDFPNSDYVYIHRIGRTGRAGRSGRAVTFFTDSDSVNLRCIANKLREAGCEIPDYMLKIRTPSRQLKRKLEKTALKRESITSGSGIQQTKKKNKKPKRTPKQS